jgi:hypothetical protein
MKLKEQVTKNHVRSPSRINIKRSERPYSPLGGTTFVGSRVNPTRPPGMSACIHLQEKKHLTWRTPYIKLLSVTEHHSKINSRKAPENGSRPRVATEKWLLKN